MLCAKRPFLCLSIVDNGKVRMTRILLTLPQPLAEPAYLLYRFVSRLHYTINKPPLQAKGTLMIWVFLLEITFFPA